MNIFEWDEFVAWLQRRHNRNLTHEDYIRGLFELIGLNRSFITHVAEAVFGTPDDPAQEGE